MHRLIAAVLMLALALGAAACAKVSQFGKQFDPRERPEVTAYKEAIAPYLVEDAIYNGPASEMLLTALPLTWPVREAMVRREAAAFALDAERTKKRLEDMRAEHRRTLVVLLRVYVPERRYNDLTESRSSWRVLLMGPDGQRLLPRDLRRITERSALNQALYPFWDHWSRLYRISFDPVDWPLAGLMVAGPPGSVVVELPLGPAPQTP